MSSSCSCTCVVPVVHAQLLEGLESIAIVCACGGMVYCCPTFIHKGTGYTVRELIRRWRLVGGES